MATTNMGTIEEDDVSLTIDGEKLEETNKSHVVHESHSKPSAMMPDNPYENMPVVSDNNPTEGISV